jgi:hypothetical protein
MNAVVIAHSVKDALKHIDLDEEYNSEIMVNPIGLCTNGSKTTQTVSHESL